MGRLLLDKLTDTAMKWPKGGCLGLLESGKGHLDMEDLLGDIFFLGLLSTVLVVWHAVGARPQWVLLWFERCFERWIRLHFLRHDAR